MRRLFLLVALAIWFGSPVISQEREAEGHQEGAQESSSPADAHETPPYILVAPDTLSVELIEDEADRDARERREEEADQRDIEDLIAQQGMNAATQAMNDATQIMAKHSEYSTLLVGIGTVLLFITLILTWHANTAAQKAVKITKDIGDKQLRAYVEVGDVRIDGQQFDFEFVCPLQNFGQTPAKEFKFKCAVVFGKDPFPDLKQAEWSHPTGVPLAPGHSYSIGRFKLDLDKSNSERPEGEPLYRVVGIAEYRDHIGEARTTAFNLRVDPNPVFLAGLPSISPEKDGNYST